MDKAFSCINNNLTLQNSKVKYLEIMRFCQDVNLLLSQLNYQNILYKTIYIIMERKFFAEKKKRELKYVFVVLASSPLMVGQVL